MTMKNTKDCGLEAGEPPQLKPKAAYISAEGDIYYTEKDLRANSKVSPPPVITDEYIKAALEAYPEVHPGWKYAFTRAAEIMEERRGE